MNYGLLFWGSSTERIKVFKLQKKMIRIMMGYNSNQSCRDLFVKLRILPLLSQNIISLLLFLNKNKNQFTVTGNSEIYHYATKQQSNFYQPPANLTKYQNGIYYLGVKVFSKLTPYIKEEFDNLRKFKQSIKNFLNEKSIHNKSILNCKIKQCT
jgi:hypothetical protein